jgi:spore cortex formation protein SpoVR/YcgB (stage V sporulation)
MHDRRPLGDSTKEMLRHIARLWGYIVRLESVDDDRAKLVDECTPGRPSFTR